MDYSIADRGRHRLALICAALIAASLAYGLSALVATAHAEGPGSGTPTDGQPRRLVHLRRGRALGR